MAKQQLKKSGNGRAKPLVAKSTPSLKKGKRYSCGGSLKAKTE